MKNQWTTKLLSAIMIVMLALAALPITPAFAAVSRPTDWTQIASGQGTGAALTANGTFAAAAGTQRYSLLAVYVVNTGGNITPTVSGTWGGVAFNSTTPTRFIGQFGSGARRGVYLFGFNETDIAARANDTVTVTSSVTTPTTHLMAYMSNYAGVNQAAAYTFQSGGDNTGGVNTSQYAATLATANGSYGAYAIVVDHNTAVTNTDATATPNTAYTATAQTQISTSGSYAVLGNKAFTGVGTTRPLFTYTGNGRNSLVGVVLAPAAASAAPVLANMEAGAMTYLENQAATAITATTTATDADSANLTGATIQITTGYQNGQDSLTFTNQLGITGTWTAATGTLALTGTTTVANYQTALRAVNFLNNSAAPTAGNRTVNFTVTDGTSNSNTVSRTVSVVNVNDAPSFTAGANQTVNEDAAAQTVAGWATALNDGDTEAVQTLTFNVTGNTNAALFSVAPAVAANGTLTYTPAANANGSATITLTLSDNGGTANGGVDTSAAQTFTITVNAVNDVPSFTKGANQTVNEDAGAQTVAGWATAISAGPANEAAQVLTFNITGNTNAALFSVAPAVAANGTLTYTPAANANGVATITLTLSDNGGVANGGVNTSAAQTFTITVNAVNDAPTFTKGADQTVLEDAGAQTVAGWATALNDGDPELAQTLTFNVTGNSNAALFSVAPAVAANGTLTYTPAANANGSATITLTLSDNGGVANGGVNTSAAQTFVINVTPVNDPSTAVNDNATVIENSGANTINVRGNDTDVDGTVDLIQSVTQPANGAVVITNGGLDVTYQPNTDYCNGGVPTDNFTYTLTSTSTATVSVAVTCQTVITASITADNKIYDGNNSATFTCTLTGVVLPDVVSCSGGTATFNDKTVANGKTVSVTGLGLTGADSAKYKLTSTSATDLADITLRTLNVTATASNKIYDGNSNASVSLSDDRVVGDVMTVSFTSASFSDPNVANGKLVTVNGLSLSGADSGNYSLASASVTTTANITIAGQVINVTTSAPASASNGASFNVAATATSGLPVAITTSGSCSGSGTDTATITMNSGTGTCSVFYNQPGDVNYTAAAQVQEDVTAQESPVITSADNASFDLGFAGSFNISATGNPSLMSISLTGTLPAGVTFTDNGDGTASLAGTPAAGSAGSYPLILTANNGVNPNGLQNFTLTVRNGPIATTVNSSPDTGNGSISENEAISTTFNLVSLTVAFSRDVYDPAGDTDTDDVSNPANYVLVRSATGTFATTSCATGVPAPDVQVSVDAVSYSNGGGSGPFVSTLTINSGLPLNVEGFYRLFVCGTTSIVDAANINLTLAGDGINPGTDFIRNFRISAPASNGGGNGGNGSNASKSTISTSGLLIPVTGFAPGKATLLPAQSNAYASSKLVLDIPSLGMKLPIVGVQFKSGWDVTWLGGNAGYLEGSAYPTWSGNTVLTGHVTDANGKPGAFAYINELKDGQKIYVHNNGFLYVYEVRQSSVILPSSIQTLFSHEEDTWLSLVTCENFDAKSGSFSNRRLVRAVLISILPDTK